MKLNNSKEMLNLLISKGADINAKDIKHETRKIVIGNNIFLKEWREFK